MKSKMLLFALCGLSVAAPVAAQTSPAAVTVASYEAGAGMSHATPRPDDLRLERALDRLRKATAPHLDIIEAVWGGWTNRYPMDCAATPDRAWAYHFMNPDLFDGKVELLRPEILMYEPQPDRTVELVGVKYVVPFDRWTAPKAPTLLDESFERNEALGAWVLQVWAWRTNPLGLFAAQNPDVSCAHAW